MLTEEQEQIRRDYPEEPEKLEYDLEDDSEPSLYEENIQKPVLVDGKVKEPQEPKKVVFKAPEPKPTPPTPVTEHKLVSSDVYNSLDKLQKRELINQNVVVRYQDGSCYTINRKGNLQKMENPPSLDMEQQANLAKQYKQQSQ